MILDFSSLQKSLNSLSEAIESTTDHEFMKTLTAAQSRTMRAGVIQSFEFTYEVSWKMLRRLLSLEEGSEAVNSLSRKDLYRLGAKKKLLDDPEAWFLFHRARNETSHIYDEKISTEVYLIALTFLPEAEKLLQNLQARV